MNRTVLDLWVGFFVVIGAAALLFLSLKVGSFAGFGSASGYVLQAPFDDVGGLKARAPVKSAGVVVGRVSEIRFDPQSYRAVVHFSVDARYSFPRDTIATILTSGLLGEQYIALEPGADTDMLKSGDTIQITQSAVVLEKLIGQFMFNRAAE